MSVQIRSHPQSTHFHAPHRYAKRGSSVDVFTSRILGALFCLCALLAFTACQQHAAEIGEGSTRLFPTPMMIVPYPTIDPMLGEELQDGEEILAGKIAEVIEASIRHRFEPGEARRDAHPKAHGCVLGTFKLHESLDAKFSKGVFIPGRSYQAWIRFSNGNEDPNRADIKGDGRGMAIKLMGVPGRKLLESESEATTQDFIMISHPVFIIDDPSRYVSLVTKTNSTHWLVKLLNPMAIPLTLGVRGSINAMKTTSLRIANPLQTRYWSMVPYQLGVGPDRQAIKFSARPCGHDQDAIPSKPDHNYLREALRNTLDNTSACMEFLVQPRTSPSMSVENSREEWKEAEAPFFPLATITIPQQTFDTPEQHLFCENLSFNPWHALPEHRPLGAVNRVRKMVYPHISALRHAMNSASRVEPEIHLDD